MLYNFPFKQSFCRIAKLFSIFSEVSYILIVFVRQGFRLEQGKDIFHLKCISHEITISNLACALIPHLK